MKPLQPIPIYVTSNCSIFSYKRDRLPFNMFDQRQFIEQLNRNRSIHRLVLNGSDQRDARLFTHGLSDFYVENANLTSLRITGVEVTDNLCTVMGRMQHS